MAPRAAAPAAAPATPGSATVSAAGMAGTTPCSVLPSWSGAALRRKSSGLQQVSVSPGQHVLERKRRHNGRPPTASPASTSSVSSRPPRPNVEGRMDGRGREGGGERNHQRSGRSGDKKAGRWIWSNAHLASRPSSRGSNGADGWNERSPGVGPWPLLDQTRESSANSRGTRGRSGGSDDGRNGRGAQDCAGIGQLKEKIERRYSLVRDSMETR